MTLGRHYLDGLAKQANVWTGLQAINKVMNTGVLQRVLPALSKYKGVGGIKGNAYSTLNFLSRPTVGLGASIGGGMGLDAMSRSDNPTLQAIGSNPALNLGLAALTPGWTALDKIPNAIGNMRMGGEEMQEKLKADAQVGKDRAISDFITLSTQGQRMFEPNTYLDAVDQGYGSPQATARAREVYADQKAPRQFSTFEKLWKPTEELVQRGIEQKAYELGKEASKAKLGTRAFGWLKNLWQAKPKPPTTLPAVPPPAVTPPVVPTGPMTAWDKTKILGGATLGATLGGATLYGGAKKIFGTPYDPAQVAEEANAAAQAAVQKRMNNLSPMERFAVRMDPTLAVGFMEKEMPGSIAKWERETGQRYNPGFLAALHDKATGPTRGKMYEFDAQGNKRFYPGQGL
jgi:hypothetical protein